MPRLFLEYQDTSIEMPPGEHLLGRDLDCRIRFNDSSVSRHHLKLVVTPLGATIQDLETTNGSTLNGKPMMGAVPVKDGDEIRFGDRALRVLMVGDDDLPTDQTSLLELEKLPAVKAAAQGASEPAEDRPGEAKAGGHPDRERCPDCGAKVTWEADACPSCGYLYPAGRPGAHTWARGRVLVPREQEKRRSSRIPIDVPVIYRSPTVEFESTATDLSRGGLFIVTDVADRVGTTCSLTLLPDGSPAVQVQAVVCRVVEKGGLRVPGIGVHFGSMSPEAHAWLVALLREARRT